MCIFSGPVKSVSSTRIFARNDGDRQFLVYQMVYAADSELAMILPLPVKIEKQEDAVDFINLAAYPSFFKDVDSYFPNESYSMSRGLLGTDSFNGRKSLQVHSVGDFDASYVPSLSDFVRLDPRFKLPRQTWDQIPQYADWGFAVFKLNQKQAIKMPEPVTPSRSRSMPEREVHPMAFFISDTMANINLFANSAHP